MNLPHPMRTLAAESQVLLWRFGWACPLAAVALAAAVLFHVAAFVPARTALVEAGTELAQASLRRQAAAPVVVPVTEEQQLRALQATLRQDVETTELIRRLGELARAEQIALAQGEYQQQLHPGTRLLQLQVTQPVKAAYPQLKRYIENVLRTMPNASLDQINARRDNVGQSQLEVRLRWSFWIHSPGAPAREGRT